MKFLTTFLLILISLQIYSQLDVGIYMSGPRISSFNSDNYKYLDTILYKSEINVDSIVKHTPYQTDTFSSCFEYRELIFFFPSDSVFSFKEPLAKGKLINSKRNGFWKISLYQFYGDPYNSFCTKSARIDLYLNNYRLFDAYYPTYNGDLHLDYKKNTIDLRFIHQIEDTSINMQITCWKDTLVDYFICKLCADSIEIFKVKSEYLDEELKFLYVGEYDRKIIYER